MANGKKKAKSNADIIEPLISTNVPACFITDTFEKITTKLMSHAWDDMDYVFVIDDSQKLKGVIEMARLNNPDNNVKASALMERHPNVLRPTDKRQKAILLALRQDKNVLPVADKDEKFMGAIVSTTLIDIMHLEHLESALTTAGVNVKRHQVLSVATAGIYDVVRYRLPWLVIGLLAGLGLGLISSRFEEKLQANIAIAYFIPVVAYIADSVGTQSEAIAVRALAVLKINPFIYLLRELFIGVSIGIFVGALGGLGAFIISMQMNIGIVVGLALFVASTIAAILASGIPFLFKAFKFDPALGSGPLSTAVQDVISIVIYFMFVLWLL